MEPTLLFNMDQAVDYSNYYQPQVEKGKGRWIVLNEKDEEESPTITRVVPSKESREAIQAQILHEQIRELIQDSVILPWPLTPELPD